MSGQRIKEKLANGETVIGTVFQLVTHPGVVDVLPDNGLDFVAAMQRIIDTAAHNGIAAGGHFSKLEHADRTIRQGGRFIPFSSDVRLIERGLPPFLSDLYAAASDAAQH